MLYGRARSGVDGYGFVAHLIELLGRDQTAGLRFGRHVIADYEGAGERFIERHLLDAQNCRARD